MIIVIADDITGAAEIAGIAWRHGLDVRLGLSFPATGFSCDVFVIATDSRSCPVEKASQMMRGIAEKLPQDAVIFKKTDSVLRGHIAAEMETLMACLHLDKALLIPQNPSKDRIIKNGIYFVDGQLLAETDFKHDPEYPALSSKVEDCIKGCIPIDLHSPFSDGINIADATSQEDIKKYVSKIHDDSQGFLMAGAADLFEAVLSYYFPVAEQTNRAGNTPLPHCPHTLIIQGSTQSKPMSNGIREDLMPDDVFHGSSPTEWIESLKEIYAQQGSLILRIGQKTKGGKAYALRLRQTMALATCEIVRSHTPQRIIVEGGATAFCILKQLEWQDFVIHREIAPGIVCLHHEHTDFIVKPGSYPWGKLLSWL